MEVLGWRSDAELVDGVRRGEDFAFGRLFERWFGRVMGVAQDILGDPQAAAEVATDTFHALWYHLDRLEDPEGFGAWAVETSRTFAYGRLSAPSDREETAPVPVLTTAPDAAAAVAVALVARGLPSAAGLGQALPGAAAAIGSPFGPVAAGAAGTAPAPAGFAGAVPPGGPPPAGFAGATLPAPPQAPPAGFAGGAPPSGFGGSPGSGSILGGSMGTAADAATQALPPLGPFGAPDDTSLPRVHRYELPERGGLLGSPQALAGIAAAVILVVVGAVLLLTRGDGNTTAADGITTTVPPAAPSISEPTSGTSTGGATGATTAGNASEPSATSATEATTTSTTRRATTTTTRATTASTASSTATSATTTTTATTTATTPTTQATTTSSSQVTRTTPTTSTSSSSSSSSSSTTAPKPVIDTFTLVLNADKVCTVGTVERGYTATWSASNATSSALTVGTNTPVRVAAGKGSSTFCAVKGTAVLVAVAGPGGRDSQTKIT